MHIENTGLLRVPSFAGIPLPVYTPMLLGKVNSDWIFCGWTNMPQKLALLDDSGLCSRCPFFAGTAQGIGRECGGKNPATDGIMVLNALMEKKAA
jgi:hypothetical protein